jgi:hypothetical protein
VVLATLEEANKSINRNCYKRKWLRKKLDFVPTGSALRLAAI